VVVSVQIFTSTFCVFSESAHPSKDAGCFAGAATVLLESGARVAMSQLHRGDRIASLDPATGRLVYSEVLLFLDRDPDRQRRFVTLTTASGTRLSLTETHLIHVAEGDCHLADCSRTAYAGSIEVGHRVLVAISSNEDDREDNFRVEEVIAISTESYRGVYAPLTATGTLVVDNVVASCYAVIDSQSVAHAAFGPLRLWANTRAALRHLVSWSSLSSSASSSSSSSSSSSGGSSVPRTLASSSEISDNMRSAPARTAEEDEALVGVHWYADLLYSVARWLMPGHMVL
jgi:hedgehog